MEEFLQVSTVIVNVMLFVSVVGIMINGFKYIDTDARCVAEAKTKIIAHGVGVVCAVFTMMILEVMKATEGIQNTNVMISMNSFMATYVVASFIFGSILMLVSKLWKKRSNASVRQKVQETHVMLGEVRIHNEIKPQEQAVDEMEKVLRVIRTRY